MELNEKVYKMAVEKLKNTVSEKRYIHSLNVAETAENLAKAHGVDLLKAKIAGVLHDITKEYTPVQHMELMCKYGVTPGDVRIFDPNVFHGFTGSIYIENVLNIDDKEILNAVKHHIVGCARMTTFEKIIFMADCTSKERKFEGVDKLRELSYNNINKAMLEKLKMNISKYSFEINQRINPYAYEAYNDIIGDI